MVAMNSAEILAQIDWGSSGDRTTNLAYRMARGISNIVEKTMEHIVQKRIQDVVDVVWTEDGEEIILDHEPDIGFSR